MYSFRLTAQRTLPGSAILRLVPALLLSMLLTVFAACTNIETLNPGIPLEGTLVGGEIKEYRIACRENTFIGLEVEQRGIDVIATLKDPTGLILAKVDGFFGASGPEKVIGITSVSGTCALEIEPVDRASAAGEFTVLLVEQRVADDDARRRVDAARVYEEGIGFEVEEELEQAVARYRDALARWTALGDTEWQSVVHYTLGQIYANKITPPARTANSEWVLMYPRPDRPLRKYDPSDAVRHLKASLELADNIPGLEARAYMNLGDIFRDLYQPNMAREQFEKALPLWKRLNDKLQEARTLNNIGLSFRELGELQEALKYYDQAIHLWREIGNAYEEANSLHNRGKCYAALNRMELATVDLENALELWNRTGGNSLMFASTLTALGGVLIEKGELEGADSHLRRALALRGENPLLQAVTKVKIGELLMARGEYENARLLFQQLLTVFREFGYKREQAIVLHKLGELQEARNPDEAEELHDQARRLSVQLAMRDLEAATLFGMARAELGQGKLDMARHHIEGAIDRVDALRRKTTGLDMRSIYFSSKQDYYDFYIMLLMRLAELRHDDNYVALALSASEKSRARSLLDMLYDSGIDLTGKDELGLFDQERELERRVEEKYSQREMMLATRPSDDLVLKSINDDLRDQLLRLDAVRGGLREHEPTYFALTQPQPIRAEDIQDELLDGDTLLLEYHLDEPHSFLFVVSRDKLRSFSLQGRGELEAMAQKVHNILTSSPEKVTLNRARLQVALSKLTEKILLPAADLLQEKRLIIVADGALQYIPFGALPSPPHLETDDNSRLIDSHSITFLPSASTLQAMRMRFANRRLPPKKIAVLADPVFLRDPRRPGSQVRDSRTRGYSSVAGRRLWRLAYSRQEADYISEQVTSEDSMVALGFQATRELAFYGELRRYQYIHFATHSIIDTEFPEMSCLAFSSVDQQGNELDGFVRIHDVYHVELNAEMVALSACNTGDGKDIRGEGLVGWTHGFMYSGAKRVLVSLWDVDDEATAELMKLFYKNVLRRGIPPSDALRYAQISIRRQYRWEAPYYWAGFVLQGEFL